MSPQDPRLSAFNIVCQCLSDQTNLQEVLDLELQKISSARDKGLITEIVYGYLRFRGRIDYVLNLFLDKPHNLPPRLKILLGLAGYELFFLDRVPDYAAVSRAVDLSARLYGRKMSGLVNAVLRKAADVDIFAENTFKKDNPDENLFWSRFYSCPLWIVKLWKKDYGRDLSLEYLKQTLSKPPLGIRQTRESQGLIGDPGYILQRKGNSFLIKDNYPEIDQYLHQGMVFRQSFAVSQAMHTLGMKTWEQPIWDMCAGSGGKTFLMLDQGISVYSSDINLKRLNNLKKTAEMIRCDLRLFSASGQFPPLKSPPGTILIDAPCTGLGVLSRRPDIKWKRQPRDIHKLGLAQSGLLKGAASVSGDQCTIVYLTCTLNRDENERRINDFLYEHKNFTLEQTFQTDALENLKEFFFGAVLKKKSRGSV
jgi:16S rRNA (cytosine967-C5)-methyltransferase